MALRTILEMELSVSTMLEEKNIELCCSSEEKYGDYNNFNMLGVLI